MIRRARTLWLLIAGATLFVSGCGTSGSNPVLYHEVRFQVAPASTGIATFSVESLNANGTGYGFPAGTTFTTTGAFNFYLDGAAPPYAGTFVQVGTAPITVSVFYDRNLVSGGNTTTGDGTQVTATALGTPGPSTPKTPLVRFDICAPAFESGGACSTADVSGGPAVSAGTFGIPYRGSIGDAAISHLLPSDSTRTTPGIYFLENTNDSANGYFLPISGQFVQAQLFVNSSLQDTVSGTGDLSLRQDLP